MKDPNIHKELERYFNLEMSSQQRSEFVLKMTHDKELHNLVKAENIIRDIEIKSKENILLIDDSNARNNFIKMLENPLTSSFYNRFKWVGLFSGIIILTGFSILYYNNLQVGKKVPNAITSTDLKPLNNQNIVSTNNTDLLKIKTTNSLSKEIPNSMINQDLNFNVKKVNENNVRFSKNIINSIAVPKSSRSLKTEQIKNKTETNLNEILNSDKNLDLVNDNIKVDGIINKNKKSNANLVYILNQKHKKNNNKNEFGDWEDSKENPKVFNNKQVKADIQIK